jgi:oligopeptide/dipeptide ABC transporter ATP-binding protein
MSDGGPIVSARGIQEYFPIERGVLRRVQGHVRAVDGVDLEIAYGQSLGLVGESGSGKSTLGRLIARLIQPTAGTLLFEGQDITNMSQRRLRTLRRDIQMVFQDPYTSLTPFNSVGESVAEPLRTHFGMRGRDLDQRVAELFSTVRLNPAHRSRYPHEFSGGQLQRISIARALATQPKLVILDEPVSSLDVSTQAEVINLLSELRSEFNVAYLFISHDLSVVRHVCDQVAVMYLGRIVERSETEQLYMQPQHPYTSALLSAIPVPDPVKQRSRERIVLKGDVPSPANPPHGCRFNSRCPVVMDVCRVVDPPMAQGTDGSLVFCHLHPPGGTTTGDAGPPLEVAS